jgi:predicted ATPase
MKITNIKIKNFKNIETANLKMTNLNVFVGPNNSGKTNFMHIFPLLDFIINKDMNDVKKSFDDGYFPKIGYVHLLKDKHKKGEIEISLSFSDLKNIMIYNYEIVIEWMRINKKQDAKLKIKKENLSFKQSDKSGPPTTLFSRDKESIDVNKKYAKQIQEMLKKSSHFLSIVRILNMIPSELNPYTEVTTNLNLILKTEIFYLSNIELFQKEKNRREHDNLGRIISYSLEDSLIELKDSSKFSILKDMLKNILKIENVIPAIIKPDKENKLKEEVKFVFIQMFGELRFLSDLSDGSILLIALITKIITCNNCVLVIEEPENSLHPKALKDLINLIRIYDEEKQFLITTHSLALINSIYPEDTIVAQISNDGISKFSRVSDSKDIIRKLKKGYLDFSDYLIYNKDSDLEFEKIN